MTKQGAHIMFAYQFVKQLWAIIYNSYVPLQILNYCTTLTRAQSRAGPIYSQIGNNSRVRGKGAQRIRQCQGGYGPLSSPHSLPMSVEMRGGHTPPATVC